MKFIHTLAFLLLIGYIICDQTTCLTEASPNVDNCKKINVDSGHCCYAESPKKTTGSKMCLPITNYQYDNIKTYAKYAKTFGGDNGETEDKDAKIDCKSFFLQFTSIILLLLLL